MGKGCEGGEAGRLVSERQDGCRERSGKSKAGHSWGVKPVLRSRSWG